MIVVLMDFLSFITTRPAYVEIGASEYRQGKKIVALLSCLKPIRGH